jgi:DNA-binding transcriptional MerR regulator
MTVDNKPLPAIPAKRYFTIGEVSELCGVKAYVLRYWEQEFTQLKPMKRRGNRRYYQHHEVLLIRRIRDLLYEQGFTISGARNQLTDTAGSHAHAPLPADGPFDPDELDDETLADATPTQAMPLVASTAIRDPAARTRATDPHLDIAELDDAALEAMARDDLAIIERAQRGLGEFATATATAARAPATGSIAAGNAGVRAAALATRRSTPTANNTSSTATAGDLSTPAEIRAELLAIRALLVS